MGLPSSKVRISSISVAAPAFNEGEGIGDLIRVWDKYLTNYPGSPKYEIIICNDGSSDNTGTVLDSLSKELPTLKPVHFTKNQGAAAALNFAIRRTSYDWVLLIDSDGQFPIDNLRNLEEALAEKSGAVLGYRLRKNASLGTRFGSWLSGLICNHIYGTKLHDFNCAMKLVSGKLLRSLNLEAKGLNYSTDVTAKLLEREIDFDQAAVRHLPRGSGKSSLRLLRDAFHRFAFVFYIAVRKALLTRGILSRESLTKE